MAAALAAVAVGLTGACANQATPSGGPEDRRPPIVIRTEPDTFGELAQLDASVRFHFNERISESVAGGDLSTAVSVSPMTGDVQVGHGRSSITVSVEGGFRPGLVYRVTLLPVVGDMFGNTMRDAFELVFTTGGDPAPTATVAGEVWDRVSGRGLSGATVQAVGADSLVHVARSDDQGVFALRYLPTGEFTLTGYDDANLSQELDPREARGSRSALVAVGDTLVVEIPVLAPDSTPAVLGSADALDSVTVVMEFDDYLDPDAPVDSIEVNLTSEEVEAPRMIRLFHEAEYARYVEQVEDSFAVLDSIEAAALAAAAPVPDSMNDPATGNGADSATVVVPEVDTLTLDLTGDSLVVAPNGPGAATGPAPAAPIPSRPTPPRLSGAPAGIRPGHTPTGRRLVGVLDGPLAAGEYEISVGSVVNINGLGDGGGEVVLVYEPPPPPADSVAADPDGALAPDSAAVTDSVAVPATPEPVR